MNPTATTKTPKTPKTKNMKVLGVALLALVLIWVVSWAYKNAQANQTTPPPPGNGAAGAGTRQEPAPDPVEYGTFMVSTSRIKEFDLLAGESIEVSPVEYVGYDWYVNGVLHLRLPKDGKPPQTRSNIPYAHANGYRLLPDQGMSEIRFAYVKYMGTAPPQSWYARALKAGSKE